MWQTLPSFHTHLQEHALAHGDHAQMQTLATSALTTLYPEIDVRGIKQGKMAALEAVTGGVEHALMYFFVQPPPSQERQHLHSMYVLDPKAFGDLEKDRGATVLFSSKDSVLLSHTSSKQTADNALIGGWHGLQDAQRRIIKQVLQRESEKRHTDRAPWQKPADEYGTCNHGFFVNEHGFSCALIFLPRESPPLWYKKPGMTVYNTAMHIVPFVKTSLNHSIAVFADDTESQDAQMQLSARTVLCQTISPAACRGIIPADEATAEHFYHVYKNLKFTADPTAQMLPAMYDDTLEPFAHTPWHYWPWIVDYYMQQVHTCGQIALLLETMQMSERTQIGALEYETEDGGFAVFADDKINGTFIVNAANGTMHLDKHLRVFRTSTLPVFYTPLLT